MLNASTKSARIKACFMTLSLAAIVLAGCQIGSRPRMRVSDFFGSPWGMRFADPNNLGPHCLDDCRDEKLGLV